jgi:DNA polymerase I-like protein with 3'-5' exonuclease and polymerase domains
MKLIKGSEIDFYYVTSDVGPLVEAIQDLDLVLLDTETYPLSEKFGHTANGLDPHTSKIRLIQIGWQGCNIPYVVDVKKVKNIQPLLDQLMREDLKKLIHNAQFDLRHIYSNFGIWLPNVYCSMTAMKTLSVSTGWQVGRMRGHSLRSLARDFCDRHLDKTEQTSDWSKDTLDAEQLEYAAMDVAPFIVDAFLSIKEALCGPIPLGYDEPKPFEIDQGAVVPIAKIEYRGNYVSRETLEILLKESTRLAESHKQKLCQVLDFPIEREIVMGDDGQLQVNTVVPDKVAKLLNNNKGLVSHINKLLEGSGLTLTNLQKEELENRLELLSESKASEADEESESSDEDIDYDYDYGISSIKELLLYKKYVKLVSDVSKHIDAINVVTGNIHTDFHIINAATGRMASSSNMNGIRVNLQQVNKFSTRAQVPIRLLGGELDELADVNLSLRGAFQSPEGHSMAICLAGDTLVYTTKGLVEIKDIQAGDQVITDGGTASVYHTKKTEGRRVWKLKTKLGYEIETTPGHRFMTVNEEGDLDFKELRHLKPNDFIVLHRNEHSSYEVDGELITEYEATQIGLNMKGRNNDKQVPPVIMSASSKIQAAFLRGLYTNEGFLEMNSKIRYVALSTGSEVYCKQIQTMLLSLGIISRRTSRRYECEYGYYSDYWLTIAEIDQVNLFRNLIGFLDEAKTEALDRNCDKPKVFNRSHNIPFSFVKKRIGKSGKPGMADLKRNGNRFGTTTRYAVNRAYRQVPHLFDPSMQPIIDGTLAFDRVVSIVDEGKVCDVYDITVPRLRRFSANGIIVHNCDYSSQELMIAAALSNDRVMLDAFFTQRDNPTLIDPEGNEYANPLVDLHTVAAMSLFPHLNEVPLWKLEKAAKEIGPGGQKYRDLAKVFNFSIIYGASAQSLAPGLKCSVEEAERFLAAYFGKFRGLKAWLDRSAKLAKKQKWVTSATGRKLFCFESNNKGSDNAVERKGPNALVQGLASDMMKMAFSRAVPRIERLNDKRRSLDPGCKIGWIQAIVHDEIVAIVPGTPKLIDIVKAGNKDGTDKLIYEFPEIAMEYAELISGTMEEVESELLSPLIGQDFPAKADPGLGFSWADK